MEPGQRSLRPSLRSRFPSQSSVPSTSVGKKIEMEIAKIRKQNKDCSVLVDNSYNMKKGLYDAVAEKRKNPIFDEINKVREQRDKHKQALSKLNDKKKNDRGGLRELSRELGRLRSVADVDREIARINNQLERGVLGFQRMSAIQHEKSLNKELKQLKKKRATAVELELLEKRQQENNNKYNPGIKDAVEARDAKSEEMKKLREEASTIRMDIDDLNNQVSKENESIKNNKKKRTQGREKIKELEKKINEIREEYRKAEETYTKYRNAVATARQRAETEKRKAAQEEEDRRLREELASESAMVMEVGPEESALKPVTKAAPTPDGAAKPQGAAGGGSRGGGAPKKPKKKKKKDDDEEEMKDTEQVQTVYEPFLDEINQHKTLIAYLNGLKPVEVKEVAAKKGFKRFGGTNEDIMNEWSMGGMSGKQGGKKKKRRKKQKKDGDLRHSLNIIKSFSHLDVDYPKTLGDVDRAIEDIKAKLDVYQQKRQCLLDGKEYIQPKEKDKPDNQPEADEEPELVVSEEPVVAV